MEKLVKQILTMPKSTKWSWPKDWLAKAISLFFALFLWYFVSGEDRVDMNVQIPVEIVNLPRNMVITNQFKSQLDVMVSGSRGLIRGVDRQHVTRSIDLSSAVPGNLVVKNDLDSIRFPRGIKTLRIQPGTINLVLDRLIQKDVPVEYVVTGKISDNYELASITMEPASLSVSGPNLVLDDVRSLKTKPIDVSVLTKSTQKQVRLDVGEELAELTGDPIVTADINIREKITEKEISNIPVQVKGIRQGFYAQATPAYVTINVALPTALEKETKNLQYLLSASIDVSNLSIGKHNMNIQTDLHQGKVTVLNLIPEKVQVEVWEKKSKKKFD
jgi:YbbR domain-containing protein